METKKQLAVATRFFKVMMPGFHHKLKLPPAVCKKLQNQVSQTVTLHSRIGAWKIKMCEEDDDDDDDALICFKKGWPEFVDRHALSIGDFAVFEHTGELHFDVYVFGSSACEREFLVEPKKEKEIIEASAPSSSHSRRRKTSDVDDESPFLVKKTAPYHVNSKGKVMIRKEVADEEISGCFMKKMLPGHCSKWARVDIPADFVRSNKLEKKKSVVLRDGGGREWVVELKVKNTVGVQFRARMGTGWHDFYASNGLKEGDVCVFELDHEQTHTSTTTNVVFNVQVDHS